MKATWVMTDQDKEEKKRKSLHRKLMAPLVDKEVLRVHTKTSYEERMRWENTNFPYRLFFWLSNIVTTSVSYPRSRENNQEIESKKRHLDSRNVIDKCLLQEWKNPIKSSKETISFGVKRRQGQPTWWNWWSSRDRGCRIRTFIITTCSPFSNGIPSPYASP